MPLYDYRCDNCSHELEVLQSTGDERLSECPECKLPQLKRLVSAPSFTFKGGGWYKDLYGSAKAASGDSKPASSPSSSGSNSTASKSDTSSSSGAKSSDKAAS